MARVLITGGAGYVGSHAVKRLVRDGHDVVVYDNLSRGHRSFGRWGTFHHGDIRDRAEMARVFKQRSIDVVMHFAALAYVGESVNAPGAYYDVNVGGTRVLLDSMIDAGVSRIVFSSSCAIYGQPACDLIDETTEPRPINPYGMTKLVGERMLRDYARAFGITYAALRYFNAAGADPECEVGEDHTPETHIVPLILDAAMGRRESVAIFGSDYPTPDGTAVRDYIHVNDLADAHARALERLVGGGESLAVNLGVGRGVSVAELVAAAREVTRRPISVSMEQRREGDPAHLVAKADLARTALGWSPRRSDVTTIIEDAWRWHQKRFAV